jgi:hypothetical protein
MNTKDTMPKDILAELVGFIADREQLCCVEKELGGDITVNQVRDALRELSFTLKREAVSESVSSQVREVLSNLSSHEEEKLLAAFGFEGGW